MQEYIPFQREGLYAVYIYLQFPSMGVPTLGTLLIYNTDFFSQADTSLLHGKCFPVQSSHPREGTPILGYGRDIWR